MKEIEKEFTLPQVGRYPSHKEWEKACWQKLSKSKNLLESLITSYERHNFVLRAAVIDRIRSGKSYRQIGEELWLSPQTISAIKKTINRDSYQSYRQRGKTERQRKKYSSSPHQIKTRPQGRPVRTKYGTIYLP